ncbi:MAG: O-antigen ligase family protein [Syntrophales bacterium]|nr:O-antigen ligase family protein [Syntrophales bacterium]
MVKILRNSFFKYPVPQIERFKANERILAVLKLSVPSLMGIFIFFTPIPHTTAIKEICFYLSVFIVFLLLCYKKIDFSFKSPFTLPFVLFTIWAFVGLFFALDKENSIHDFRAHLLRYLCVYYLLINFFNSPNRLRILSWIIIVSAASFSIGGLGYFYLVLGNPISERFGFSEMMNIDLIGFVTIFAMLLSLHLFRLEESVYYKGTLVVCLLGTSMATYFTMSRGSLVAACIALIAFFCKRSKRLVVLLISCSLIAVGTVPALKARFSPDLLKEMRIGINLTTLEILKDYPITGIGFGMETYGNKKFIDLGKYNARVDPRYQQRGGLISAPHNSFADVAVRTGIVGFALFLAVYVVFVRLCWSIIRYGKDDYIRDWGVCVMAAFVGVFVQELFADGMFGPQAIALYTILAMITILCHLNSELVTTTTSSTTKEPEGV